MSRILNYFYCNKISIYTTRSKLVVHGIDFQKSDRQKHHIFNPRLYSKGLFRCHFHFRCKIFVWYVENESCEISID
jgi:hypothetical protein